METCAGDETCHVVLCMVAAVMSPQTKRCDKSVLQCSVFGPETSFDMKVITAAEGGPYMHATTQPHFRVYHRCRLSKQPHFKKNMCSLCKNILFVHSLAPIKATGQMTDTH